MLYIEKFNQMMYIFTYRINEIVHLNKKRIIK